MSSTTDPDVRNMEYIPQYKQLTKKGCVRDHCSIQISGFYSSFITFLPRSAEDSLQVNYYRRPT